MVARVAGGSNVSQGRGPRAGSAQQQSDGSWMARGAQGAQVASHEREEAAERRAQGGASAMNPYRFRLQPREEADIIILDRFVQNPEDPNDGVPFIFEHQLPGPKQKWDVYETCPRDFANCAVCDRFSRSYHAMYLSCLDLRGFLPKQGDFVPQSKKLLRVKTASPVYEQLQQIFAIAMSETGTIRGCHMVMSRDSSGQDANIGMPKMLAQFGGRSFEVVPEEALASEFGHPEVRSQQGQVIRPANFDITVYDYSSVFQRPDPNRLRQVYGGGQPVPGSQQETDQTVNQDNAWNSQTGAQADAPPQSGEPRVRTRSRVTGSGQASSGGSSGIQRAATSVPQGTDEAF